MNAAKSLKVVRWLLAILLLPAFVYLLGANLFLRFGLPFAFKSTNTVNATLRSGWTVWPGVVHVRGVRIVFQDYNLQWSLDIEQAKIKLRLGELLSMTFHATEVTGTGTVFRMRHRIEPASKDQPWVKTLPPIPEFPAPAVFEAQVPEPPVTDANYKLWTVHLENVDVGVREAWVQFIRYRDDRGGGRARGAFRLKPARMLWVGPASLTLDAGQVTLGDQQLARALSGKISCTVHPFDVRAPNGREVLRFISTELTLKARDATPDPILPQLFADSGLSLQTVPGTLTLSARVQRGKFSEDSSLRLESPRVHAQFRDWRLDAKEPSVGVAGAAGERAETSLRFSEAELTSSASQARPARIRGALLTNVTAGLDAAGEATDVERRVGLEHLDIPDARLLNAFSGAVRFVSGTLAAEVHGTERDGTVQASGHAHLQRLHVRSGRTEARLDGKLLATLFDARPQDGSGRLTLDAQLSASRLHTSDKGESGLDLSEPGKLSMNAELRRDARGLVRSQLRVAGSNLTLTRLEGTERREVARLTDARLDAELRRDARGLVDSKFRLAGANLTLTRPEGSEQREVARVTDPRLKGSLQRNPRGLLDADFSAQSARVHALIGQTWLRARSNLSAKLFDFDQDRERGRVASEIFLDRAAAVSQGGSDCPWGTLPNARVRFDLDFTRQTGFAKLHATLAKARFTWGDFRAQGGVELSARIYASDRQQGVGSLDFSTRIRDALLKSGKNANEGWDAKIPELVFSGKFNSTDKVSGTLTVSAPRAEARIGQTKMQTDFDARTAFSAIDLERQEARFSGKFALSNARLSAGRDQIEGWWANIDADSALVIARENVDLSVPFRAKLRDALPGMAILAAEGSIPALIADALPLRELSVVGTVQRRCRLTNIRFAQASGGPLLGRGLLNSTSDVVRGAFLFRLSDLQAISAGVRIAPSDTGVALFAGDDWLRERTQALEAMVKQTLEQPCESPPAECSDETQSD